jgi:hypothetical protein
MDRTPDSTTAPTASNSNPPPAKGPVPLDLRDLARVGGGLPRVGSSTASVTTANLPRVGG